MIRRSILLLSTATLLATPLAASADLSRFIL